MNELYELYELSINYLKKIKINFFLFFFSQNVIHENVPNQKKLNPILKYFYIRQ